jgi:hypothetical protein
MSTLLSLTSISLRLPHKSLRPFTKFSPWAMDCFVPFLAVPYFKWFKHLQLNFLIDFQNDCYRSNLAQRLSFPKFWKSIFVESLVKHLMSINSEETHPFNLNLALQHIWPIQIPSNLFSYIGNLFHFSEIYYTQQHFSSS